MKRDRHILYIEDEPDSAEVVKALIEGAWPDVIVEVCSSAAGAEQALNARCYDLVMIDLCLPFGIMGNQIAGKILERDPNQSVQIVSAYRGHECQLLANKIGLELEPKMGEELPTEFLERVRHKLDQRPCAAIGMQPLRPIELISPHVREARTAA